MTCDLFSAQGVGASMLLQEQRVIVLQFRRLHLKQQERERDVLQDNIIRAIALPGGQPQQAVILWDAMSSFRSITPKIGGRAKSQSKISHSQTNRVIGETLSGKCSLMVC